MTFIDPKRPSSSPPLSPARARIALAILFIINLANYADRYLVVALGPRIKEEFLGQGITDGDIGLISSSFVIVYMLASPFAGYLSDRIQRRYVVSAAIVLWSLATAIASRAPSFFWLLVARAAVGIGEAGYMAAGSALLTDLFPEEKRSRAMAIFNLAIPVGSAMGYYLAGYLGHAHGWRSACLYVGGPGILLAPLALLLQGGAPPGASASGPGGLAATARAYATMLKDSVYTTNLVGMALMTFALGGLAQWTNPWLEQAHSMTPPEASGWTGKIVAGSGFVGTALGAVVADFFAKRGGLVRSYAFVTAAGYALAAPLLLIALGVSPLDVPTTNVALALIFVAMVGSFLGTGPSNAIVAERAPAEHRATAFALQVFAIHFLGDAASPPIMGSVADFFRARGASEAHAYTRALSLAPIALGVAAIAMNACAIVARREEQRKQ